MIIGSLPSQISFLQKLVVLDVSYNSMSHRIPKDIGMVKTLEVFNLQNNSFSGDLPDSFYSLYKLKKLYLGNNLLVGEVSKLSSLSNLEIVVLKDNYFTGAMHLSSNQTKLRIID